MRATAPLWLLGALLALTGCVSGLQSNAPATREYQLLASDCAPASPTLPVELVLDEVTAAPGLASDALTLLQADRERVPYAGARWVAPVPELVAAVQWRYLERCAGLARVAAERRWQDSARLHTRVLDFQFEPVADAPPLARVTLRQELIPAQAPAAPVSFIVTATAPAASHTLHALVAAQEQALNDALAQSQQQLRQRLRNTDG